MGYKRETKNKCFLALSMQDCKTLPILITFRPKEWQHSPVVTNTDFGLDSNRFPISSQLCGFGQSADLPSGILVVLISQGFYQDDMN